MSFRVSDVDGQEASVRKQFSSLNKKIVSAGLPEGFSWLVVENGDGTRTLSVVDDVSGLTVMGGFDG